MTTTIPLTLPPGVAPAQLVGMVFLQRHADGRCSALHSEVAGSVPMERAQIIAGLRGMADLLEQQAETLGDR